MPEAVCENDTDKEKRTFQSSLAGAFRHNVGDEELRRERVTLRKRIRNAFRADENRDTAWTQIRHSLGKYFLGTAAISFAVAFPRYFDHLVYFPAFPNILDSVGMGIIGAYLLYDATKEVKRRVEEKRRKEISHAYAGVA